MQIWPAIDLLGGKCVRLQQGDYDRETVFSEDPVAMARQWEAAGANCLHLVDLDGAKDGTPTNREIIARIVEAVSMTCEVGGGVRDEQTIRDFFDLGIHRLVIGTQALRQPEWFSEMCRLFPGRLVLGIDARNGQVATDGWQKTSQTCAVDLARQFAEEPLAAVVYTDIATDGMLCGPNLNEMRTMTESVRVPVVASGGISSIDDLNALARIPVAGAIIGRAIYEGTLDLNSALQVFGTDSTCESVTTQPVSPRRTN